MKNYQQHNWNIPQRQSAAGLLVIIYKAILSILRFAWPFLLLAIFSRENREVNRYEVIAIVLSGFVLVKSMVEFFYFRFYIHEENLVIRKGFLSRKVITIPLAKIQSVRIEQNILHQVLDVAKLSLDTAGSEKTEAEIDAITLRKAESFRQFLLESEKIGSDAEMEKRNVNVPIIKLASSDLLKLGISANHIQAFFIVFAFAVSMLQNLEEIFGNDVINIVKESSSDVDLTFRTIAVLIIMVMIVSIAVSMIRIVLNYFDFECNETSQGFRIKSGLVNTKQNLVPFSKIQYISWDANWIRRKIGLYMLEFHQAQNEQAKRKQRVRLPVTRIEFIKKLLKPYHEEVQPVAHSSHSIHKVYPWRRMLISGIPTAILLSTFAYFWIGSYGLFFLLWIPYSFIASSVYQKKFRLYISPEAFQVNRGAWGKESQVAQWYKIQYLQVRQSIYQRRRNLATIMIHTAGGHIRIPYVTLELARTFQNYAVYKLESSRLQWI